MHSSCATRSPAAQVFTLSSADRPYRLFVENMRDGAATVSEAGTVLYANRRLAELIARPLQHIIGSPVDSLIATATTVDAGWHQQTRPKPRSKPTDRCHRDRRFPVRVNTSRLDVDSQNLLCVTFADLTEQNAQKLEIERLSQAQAERMGELEARPGRVDPRGHARRSDRPSQPQPADRSPHPGARACRAVGNADRTDLRRPRQLQGDQRHRGACSGRCGAAPDREAAAQRGAPDGQRVPARRRRIRRPAPRSGRPQRTPSRSRARIARTIDPPIDLDYGPVPVTASIGVSICDPAAPGHTHPRQSAATCRQCDVPRQVARRVTHRDL